MKKLTTIIFFTALFISKGALGQVESYLDTTFNSHGCTSSIEFYCYIGSNPETGGILSVDWGDGTPIETINFTGNSNDYFDTSLYHNYITPGTYTVNSNCYSTTSGMNVDAGQTLNIVSDGNQNCGTTGIQTLQNSPYLLFTSAQYDFTGFDGITQTKTADYYGFYNLDINNVPYTVSINDNWLLANNLMQDSPDFVINSFDSYGQADNGFTTMLVSCDIPSSQPDFYFNYLGANYLVASAQFGFLYMVVCSSGCSPTSNTSMTVELPTGFTPTAACLASLTNPVVSGNFLTFDILNLSGCRTIRIYFNFPGSTPAGTVVCFNAAISTVDDSNTTNNTASTCPMVVNSYDPNVKNVNLPTNIDPTTRETLTYDIHFQNDGNGDALNIVVRDTISSNLDLSTFQVLGSKHSVSTSVNPSSREVVFSFYNINLVPSSDDLDSSQGFVVYSIMENAGLPVDSEIENTAYIYFDFNPAIVTNTTYNVNTVLGIDENAAETITLYPNPAQNSLYFKGAIVKSVSIFDLAGKRVLNAEQLLTNEISIAGIANGIYQVVVATEKGTQTQKLVVRK